MKHLIKKTMGVAALLAGIAMGVSVAQAGYPEQPIRLIVPFSAGGGTDITARIVAEDMSKTLGQPVLVDNRPGAQGIVGTKEAAGAKPDGYTMVFVLQATLALNPSLYTATNYDPVKDFEPIGQISESPYVVVVHPNLGVKTLAELVAKAKAAPGSINFASGAAASFLASRLLQQAVSVELTHIPYNGSGPAITDLLSGRVSLMLSSPVSVLPHIKAGKLIPLAVTGAKRSPSLPELPTVAELGYPDFAVSGWYGFAAPAGTPKEFIDKLNQALVQALAKPEVQAGLEKSGVEGKSSSPDELKALIASEIARWTAMIKEAGIQPE